MGSIVSGTAGFAAGIVITSSSHLVAITVSETIVTAAARRKLSGQESVVLGLFTQIPTALLLMNAVSPSSFGTGFKVASLINSVFLTAICGSSAQAILKNPSLKSFKDLADVVKNDPFIGTAIGSLVGATTAAVFGPTAGCFLGSLVSYGASNAITANRLN